MLNDAELSPWPNSSGPNSSARSEPVSVSEYPRFGRRNPDAARKVAKTGSISPAVCVVNNNMQRRTERIEMKVKSGQQLENQNTGSIG